MKRRKQSKPASSPSKLNVPVAKPGHVTEAQRQRVNADGAIVRKIMLEPAPQWMQVGGSAGPSLANEPWRFRRSW